jgi:predicted ATPase/transcriptional regulator with XRE-family HTH domain
MEAAGRPHFGALLRQFRLDAGITQQELAERAKLSVEAIGTLERGTRTRPHRDTVVLLGRALELSPEREALLESAVGVAHPSRQRERSDALNASLLRIVRADAHGAPRHNLPLQLTSFVGRQHEVRAMTALLREHRLVTVVGAGGVGKTRIAVQTGSELLDGYPDGVWLIDLAPLSDQTLVPSAVLAALQLPSTTGSALDAVVSHLKARRLLLILDNCEHVIEAAREVAAGIAQSCPYVRILATSRAALDLPYEWPYGLPSLAAPCVALRSARDALPYSAVALFVDRAVAVNASFALTDDNASDVAEICRRLDGIPLAIELAAARVKVIAPRQIVQRLDQRFRLLTGGDSGTVPRHQTMTALIGWSYDLLTPREQRFFEWLSVFAGGCTLEAATSVCAIEGEDDIEVIDLIASLVTKSLLVAELAENEERYHLLESSRQYARAKLLARDEYEQVARRHALYYVDVAQRLEAARDTAPEREWAPQAKVELDNWRVVMEWTLGKRRDVILGQHLVAARRVVWVAFTPAEGRHWVRAALGLVDELTPASLVALLDHAEAEGGQQFGNRVALAAAKRALARYRGLGDVLGVARAQHLVGSALVSLGRVAEGETFLREALKTGRKLGNLRLTANALLALGVARGAIGDLAGARAKYAEALGLAKILGADSFVAPLTLNLAAIEFSAGDPEEALRLTIELLATRSALSSASPNLAAETTASGLSNAAAYLIALGRYDEARARANEALEFAHVAQLAIFVAISLQHLAIAVLRSQVEGRRKPAQCAGAARLIGFARARNETLGFDVVDAERDNALVVLRDAIGAEELANLLAAGATMTQDEAIAQGEALASLQRHPTTAAKGRCL